MRKRYDPTAPSHTHSGSWEKALLLVVELMSGPEARYTDLADALPGIGTNILADRLRDLEAGGIVEKKKLPPPAASRVRADGVRARAEAEHQGVGAWGARLLGPPTHADELFPGWLRNAFDMALAPIAPPGRFEFRVGDEVASIVDGETVAGPVEDPDVVIEGDAEASTTCSSTAGSTA